MKERTQGFNKSFYIARSDIDFYFALISMLRARGLDFSPFIMFCLRYVVLDEGKDFFTDFKEHYQKVIEEKLSETYVRYKGQRIKLSELVDNELFKEGSYVKI